MSNFIDYQWRKEYRKWLIGIGIVGVIIIFSSEFLVNKFLPIGNITISEKILGSIYFVTATIIFWYTRETFDLKVIQQKELIEIRKQTDFQITPYLRIQWSNNKDEIFHIINDGKGLAINLRFLPFSPTTELVLNIKHRPVISSGGYTIVSTDELFSNIKQPSIIQDTSILKGLILSYVKNSFSIEATYKDIMNNQYNVVFCSDPTYNDLFYINSQKRVS